MEFQTWGELAPKERAERENIKTGDLCTFGISVLDHALKCILPHDLIVIGADSGTGKSTLSLSIASHNAKNGKQVAVFYLEGGHNEAIRRMKWRMICDEYYKNKPAYGYIDMDYLLWSVNDPSLASLKPVENSVDKNLNALFRDNLSIYNITPSRGDDKNIVGYKKIYESLVNFFDGTEFGKIKFNLDLLIIDHLHYFDFEDGTRATEAEKISKAIRSCKEISDIHEIPVILVSHLRKKTKERGLPDQEDFHGSSNIPKIATEAIILSPCYSLQDNVNFQYPTFFRFVKSRRGLKSNYAALINFDLTANEYAKDYKIYPISNDGFAADKELEWYKCPKWAKRANDAGWKTEGDINEDRI